MLYIQSICRQVGEPNPLQREENLVVGRMCWVGTTGVGLWPHELLAMGLQEIWRRKRGDPFAK